MDLPDLRRAFWLLEIEVRGCRQQDCAALSIPGMYEQLIVELLTSMELNGPIETKSLGTSREVRAFSRHGP